MTGGASSSSVPFEPLKQYMSARDVAQQKLQRSLHGSSNQNSDLNMRRSNSAGLPARSASQADANSGGSGGKRKNSTMLLSPSTSSSSATNSPRSSTLSPGEYILKVVLIGDSGVGKSNLVMRFTKNKYQSKSVQTVGFEFAAKTIRVGDRRIKAQIWDTAGQERFQSLTAAYYRNAVGAMIVYDITNRSSFEHVTGWLAQVHEHAHENLVLILVGNKCDLAHLPQTREVSTLEAARFAAANGMEFLETSALDATNVVDAFKKVIVPVGRLLSPAANPDNIVRLPHGWRRVLSRTR